jgi:cathepsin H
MAKKLPAAVFKCAAPRDSPALLGRSFNEHPENPTAETLLTHAPTIFAHWKVTNGRSYASDADDAQRFANFKATLQRVGEHNARQDATYTLEANKFADMTWAEFRAVRFGAEQHCSATHTSENAEARARHTAAVVPDSIDWRQKGVVSPVKDQGSCGSCWTFSTTGCLESHHYMRTGKMVSLSEQQLVDCAQDYDNNGCNGGLPSHAFEYIHSAGGLDTESAYPYTAKDGQCHIRPSGFGATVKASVNITAFDEKELTQAVASVGPVSIAFQVADDFQSYKSGVYNNPKCSTDPQSVNHAVLAVGFDSDPKLGPYWIIKNSWSSDWGEQGYFRMVKGVNACGIADCASYPLL